MPTVVLAMADTSFKCPLAEVIDDPVFRVQQARATSAVGLPSERAVFPGACYLGPYLEREEIKELFVLETMHHAVAEALSHAAVLAERQVHLRVKDTSDRLGCIVFQVRWIAHAHAETHTDTQHT